MATLTANNPTMLDLAQAMDPDGTIAAVVELLNKTNEILEDITFIEGNLPTGHRSTVRTGIPRGTWRRMYGFVTPGKSQRAQVTDTCGMLEAYNEIDKEEAELNGNSTMFMMSETQAQLEGMSQDLADTLFHGSTVVYPERFDGFSVRYNDLSAENADNIIDADGTGSDNASIWLVVWSPMTCFGIVPKDSVAGLNVQYLGEQTIQDVVGQSAGKMQAYVTHYKMKAGLCLKDWRFVVRICNIDRSALTSDASSGANLPELMFQAMELIPNLSMGRACYYMDRSVRTKWRQQYALLTKSSTLGKEDTGGAANATTFNGIPVKRCDALAPDEAQVT